MLEVLERNLSNVMALCDWEVGSVMEEFLHKPVLVDEVIENLAVHPQGVYIDCTVGEGGHASAVLGTDLPGIRLLGIDLDSDVLERAKIRLEQHRASLALTRGNYAQIGSIALRHGFMEPNGILMDLGISSFQLGRPMRGFSFQKNEPLDMRFSRDGGITAAYIVNTYSKDALASLLWKFGDERKADRIARSIVDQRPIETTSRLANIVCTVTGGRRGKIHPATRTFQALRIAVNSELVNLEMGLASAIDTLKPGGRLLVISYHSLEDRIVKTKFSTEAKDCHCPPSKIVCDCNHTATIKIITKHVVVPSRNEILGNPRSRSARMRVIEKLPIRGSR